MNVCRAYIAARANPKWPSPFQVKCEFLPFQRRNRGNPLDPSEIRIYVAYQIIWPSTACRMQYEGDPNVPPVNDCKSKCRSNILIQKN